jgi:hypothetical protein
MKVIGDVLMWVEVLAPPRSFIHSLPSVASAKAPATLLTAYDNSVRYCEEDGLEIYPHLCTTISHTLNSAPLRSTFCQVLPPKAIDAGPAPYGSPPLR